MFLDEAVIYVKSGDGGAGVVRFRREKYVPFGGPAGGDGGRGGAVVLIVNPHLNTLSHFQHKNSFLAQPGSPGGSSQMTGASGETLEVEVPPGTTVWDDRTGELIADLTRPGQRVVVAVGGRGGRGNARFKSSTNQAPRMAEKGEPGQERWLRLELKLLADVGIVGVPNAGKSTLLSVVTQARPKIAPYPFTTLTPNLGVAILGDREVVLADIPGLVEGAHAGVGLGHSFLRHVQRTRLLLHLLDGAGEDPIADFVQTNAELALFDQALVHKPQIVVLTKLDLPQAQAHLNAVRAYVEEHALPFASISAATHMGIQELMGLVARTLAELPEPPPPEEVPLFHPEWEDDLFQIVREVDAYRVVGKRIERAADMTYWEYDEALVRFHRILTALGIADALREAGIKPGDTVRIGHHELEWVE